MSEKEPKYKEGDVVELFEGVARNHGNILQHVIVGWRPAKEKYVIRQMTGARHSEVSENGIFRLVTDGDERDSVDADISSADYNSEEDRNVE